MIKKILPSLRERKGQKVLKFNVAKYATFLSVRTLVFSGYFGDSH